MSFVDTLDGAGQTSERQIQCTAPVDDTRHDVAQGDRVGRGRNQVELLQLRVAPAAQVARLHAQVVFLERSVDQAQSCSTRCGA